MKRLTSLLLFSLPVICYGQSFDRTVKIENQYNGVPALEKKEMPMQVPDSLKSFDYRFDYDVFETPYKGAFEFNPYETGIEPVAPARHRDVLLLRAGTGYSLSPVLNAVYTPADTGRFIFGIRQNLDGWNGRYRTVRRDLREDYPLYTTKGVRHDGNDIREHLAAYARYRTDSLSLYASASYDGLFTSDDVHGTSFNGVGLTVGVKSYVGSSWMYDVSLNAKLSQDRFDDEDIIGLIPVTERIFGLKGRVSTTRFGWCTAFTDVDMQYVGYPSNGPDYDNSFFFGCVRPGFSADLGVLDLEAGLRLDVSPKFRFVPELHARIPLGDRIRLYADYTGGQRMNSYSSLKASNHWFFPGYGTSLEQSYVEMDARVGAAGSLFSHLQYDFSCGYSSVEDMPLWGLTSYSDRMLCALCYRDYSLFSADLNLGWRSGNIEADGNFAFRKSSLDRSDCVFGIPTFSGDARVLYRWHHRICAGLELKGRTSLELEVGGIGMEAQAYINPGIYAEYLYSRKMSFWIRGTNLTNSAIQDIPLHVESGMDFMAGIVLKL